MFKCGYEQTVFMKKVMENVRVYLIYLDGTLLLWFGDIHLQ